MWYGPSTPSENLVKRLFPPPHPCMQEWVRRLEYYRMETVPVFGPPFSIWIHIWSDGVLELVPGLLDWNRSSRPFQSCPEKRRASDIRMVAREGILLWRIRLLLGESLCCAVRASPSC